MSGSLSRGLAVWCLMDVITAPVTPSMGREGRRQADQTLWCAPSPEKCPIFKNNKVSSKWQTLKVDFWALHVCAHVCKNTYTHGVEKERRWWWRGGKKLGLNVEWDKLPRGRVFWVEFLVLQMDTTAWRIYKERKFVWAVKREKKLSFWSLLRNGFGKAGLGLRQERVNVWVPGILKEKKCKALCS